VIVIALIAGVLTFSPLFIGERIESPAPNNATRGTDPVAQRSRQAAGQSAVGKNEPGRPEDAAGSKARDITHSAQPLSVTPEQKEKLRGVLGPAVPRAEPSTFTIVIGASVPEQVELRPLPAAATDMLQGYQGAFFTTVGDQLVIVDGQARRVVAIIPGFA
jgi:hypothetical protein